jgi:hypothetical protein
VADDAGSGAREVNRIAMTRIENSAPHDSETFKREIREELRSEDRRKIMLRFGGCALAAFLIIAIPTVFVVSVVAKTGLVDVPVFSALLFKPGAPSRVVLPLVGEKPDQVMQIIATRMSYDPATSYLTIPIREDELTMIVQDAIAQAPPDTLPFSMKDAQIAIDDNDVELFSHLSRGSQETTLVARFLPTVVSGQFTIDVDEMQIGSLTVPHWIASPLIALAVKPFLSSLQTNLSAVGTLERVDVQQGTLQLVFHSTPPQ